LPTPCCLSTGPLRADAPPWTSLQCSVHTRLRLRTHAPLRCSRGLQSSSSLQGNVQCCVAPRCIATFATVRLRLYDAAMRERSGLSALGPFHVATAANRDDALLAVSGRCCNSSRCVFMHLQNVCERACSILAVCTVSVGLRHGDAMVSPDVRVHC
jgi:hypothetical protein